MLTLNFIIENIIKYKLYFLCPIGLIFIAQLSLISRGSYCFRWNITKHWWFEYFSYYFFNQYSICAIFSLKIMKTLFFTFRGQFLSIWYFHSLNWIHPCSIILYTEKENHKFFKVVTFLTLLGMNRVKNLDRREH